MNRAPPVETITGFTAENLALLMPLHVLVEEPGTIIHVGPTFAKLLDGRNVQGQNIFGLMEFRRPTGLRRWEGLVKAVGMAIRARLVHDLPDYNLKAVCVPLQSSGRILLNFSLGAGMHDIISLKNLKGNDFSPADPTGEMLYLTEIQSVVMNASRELNNRLNGAKIIAEEQAFTDSLTGLNNRRALEGFIRRLQDRNAKGGFAVMQIDLDFFKAVNDTYGHAAGDHVLQEVAHVLLSETRSTDMVARIGGDEFVIVLSDYHSADNLREIGQRIIDRLAIPIPYGDKNCRIGASIGAVIVPHNSAVTFNDMLARADTALYRSKQSGRGQINLAAAPPKGVDL